MANVKEWFKGVTFFVFVTLMFYFLWQYIFSNIIEFVGTDVFSLGSEGATSVAIMKTFTWISFVFLYLSTSGVYLIYSIIIGSKGEVTTHPIELLKAIGIWSIMMPIMIFIHGITFYMVDSLNAANIINTSMETVATQFSWIMSLIIMLAMIVLPFVFVLKGYGVDIFGKAGGSSVPLN